MMIITVQNTKIAPRAAQCSQNKIYQPDNTIIDYYYR